MADKTIGQVAYEAAAAVTGCEQPWSDANQKKWEAAAAGVREHDNKLMLNPADVKDIVRIAKKETEKMQHAKTIERVLEAVDDLHKDGGYPCWDQEINNYNYGLDDAIKAIKGVGDETVD